MLLITGVDKSHPAAGKQVNIVSSDANVSKKKGKVGKKRVFAIGMYMTLHEMITSTLNLRERSGLF